MMPTNFRQPIRFNLAKPVQSPTSPVEPKEALPYSDEAKDAIAPVEQAVAPSKSAPRRRAKEVTPEEQARIDLSKAILKAYELEMGETARDIAWGRSGKAAKVLAQRGYTPEQVAAAYQHIKRDRFWADKIVHLDRVADNIGSIMQHQQKGETAGESASGRFSFRNKPAPLPPPSAPVAPPAPTKPKILPPSPEAIEAAKRRLQDQLGKTFDD